MTLPIGNDREAIAFGFRLSHLLQNYDDAIKEVNKFEGGYVCFLCTVQAQMAELSRHRATRESNLFYYGIVKQALSDNLNLGYHLESNIHDVMERCLPPELPLASGPNVEDMYTPYDVLKYLAKMECDVFICHTASLIDEEDAATGDHQNSWLTVSVSNIITQAKLCIYGFRVQHIQGSEFLKQAWDLSNRYAYEVNLGIRTQNSRNFEVFQGDSAHSNSPVLIDDFCELTKGLRHEFQPSAIREILSQFRRDAAFPVPNKGDIQDFILSPELRPLMYYLNTYFDNIGYEIIAGPLNPQAVLSGLTEQTANEMWADYKRVMGI